MQVDKSAHKKVPNRDFPVPQWAYYNEERPHSAVGYRTPLEAYTNRFGPEGLNFIRAKGVSNG